MRKAFIRPVHKKNDGPLIGLALCRTNGPPLVDEDIIEHFPADTPGKHIKEEATDMGYEAEWGNVLET